MTFVHNNERTSRRTHIDIDNNNIIMTIISLPPSAVILSAILCCVSIGTSFADDSTSDQSEYLNVYGESLQPCSYDGMALTGYTRSGYCVDRWNDQGSHHICIDLSSLGGGGSDNENTNNENNYDTNNQNFCEVTGQSDWCSLQDMPCHEDPDYSGCPVTNWCVCQWAFASYIEKSGGCDNIQTVVCESINLEAVLAYQKESSKWNANPKYYTALSCIMDRCGLDASSLPGASGSLSSAASALIWKGRRGGTGICLLVLVVVAASAVVGGIWYRKHVVVASKTIQLDDKDGILGGLSPVGTGSHTLLRDEKSDGIKFYTGMNFSHDSS